MVPTSTHESEKAIMNKIFDTELSTCDLLEYGISSRTLAVLGSLEAEGGLTVL